MPDAAHTPLPIAILASGSGSNFQAIAEAIEQEQLDATIRVLISNTPQAPVLKRAQRFGIETRIVADCANRAHYAEALIGALQSYRVELVCLAGFMRILSPAVIHAFEHRIMNIHPSLLPKYPGLHAVRQALAAGATETGVTVHFVDEGVDTGAIIVQERVPIEPGETEAQLLTRMHAVEHRLYPQAIQWFAHGHIAIINGQVALRT